jgi:hypothetical protein
LGGGNAPLNPANQCLWYFFPCNINVLRILYRRLIGAPVVGMSADPSAP